MKNRPKFAIAIALGTVAVACLALWVFGENGASDFGLNAFTETLGIAVTVFLIDHLIKRHEQHKFLPQRASAYEDVRLMTSRIVSFWTHAYRVSVPEPPPKSVVELLSEETIQKIGSFLHLDSMPNIAPARSCWDWIDEATSDSKRRSEQILERHNGMLDPNAYAAVHTVASDIMVPGLMRGMLSADQQSGFPRPRNFGSYCFFQRPYFDAVLRLIEWCESERKCLEDCGYPGLKEVCNSVHPWTLKEDPQCMIPSELLKKQMAEVADFRARTKA
jgi:hypothetical protein